MQKKTFNLNTFTIKSLFLLVGIILSGCLPLQKTTECADNEAFDPARRKCVPTLGASTSSTVFINNKVPENSYTTTTSGNDVTHSIAVSDVYSFGYATKWILHYNGSSIVNGQVIASNTLSYNFDPSSLLGEGSYILEAVVYDIDGNVQIDSVSWAISIAALAPPTLTSPSPAGSSFSFTSESISETLSLSLSNPDNQSGKYNWYLDGVIVKTGNFTSATNSLSDTINPSIMTKGLHTLELELNDGAGNIFDSHLWTLIIIDPELPIISHTTPNNLDAITVVDGVTFATGGYLDASGSALTEICITVDDFDKVTTGVSDIDVEFSINGNVEHAATFSDNEYCSSTFSTINLNNPDIGESKTLNIKVLRAGTNTIIDYRQISLSVRPKNIRPSIAIDSTNSTISCVNEVSSSTFTSCTMTQSVNVNQDDPDTNYTDASDIDNGKTFAITITDPDITNFNVDSDYEVFFQLKKATDASYNELDGTNAYSTVTCQSTLGDGTAVYNTRRTCTLHMDAFNANGPIEPGIYLLKAFVRDNGSTYDVGNQKTSDSVSWEITVNEYQSNSITILGQDTNIAPDAINGDDGSGNPLSWVEASNVNCTSTGTLLNSITSPLEGTWILVHTKVQDIERDHFEITVEMENNFAGGGFTAVKPRTSVFRSENDLTYTVDSCFQIPEWTVSGMSTDIVDIKVSVSDLPTSENSVSASETFSILVGNLNPTPEFTNDGDEDYSDKHIVAGYPFTITPPSFSDASVSDGKVVTWKWQVSTDGGTNFTDIPKADSDSMSNTTLIWTPDHHTTITPGDLHLKICLGDDGFGNELSNCVESKEYTNLTIHPSVHEIEATSTNTSNAYELASWHDQIDDILYVAYASGTKIVVEKITFGTNGEFETDSSISFNTEEPSKTSVQAYDLSIDGYNSGGTTNDSKSLLLAYKVNSSPTGSPEIRIRRIYIDNGKMSFHYSGLYNDDDTTNDLLSTGNGFETHATISEGSREDETTITITDYVNLKADNSSITLNGITFTEGANFCNPDTCTDNDSLASSLKSAIENSVDEEISKTLTVSVSGPTITIKGFPREDYYDETSKVSTVIGDIKINSTNWYLPFADAFNDLKISVLKGTNANKHKGDWSITSNSLATNSFNQEIANTFTKNNKLIITTKGSNGNVDVYNYTTGFTLQRSLSNLFNLSGFNEVDKISVSSEQTSSPDNLIWISAISTSSADESYLSLAVLDESDFSYSQTTDFSLFSNTLTKDIDKAKIISRNSNADEAIVSLITSSDNPSPNEAYLLKFTIDSTDITNSSIALKENHSKNLAKSNSIQNSQIAATPISNMTRGSEGATTDENKKDSLFFLWHESVSGQNRIKAGMFNIEEENITTDSAMTGSYPANIAP